MKYTLIDLSSVCYSSKVLINFNFETIFNVSLFFNISSIHLNTYLIFRFQLFLSHPVVCIDNSRPQMHIVYCSHSLSRGTLFWIDKKQKSISLSVCRFVSLYLTGGQGAVGRDTRTSIRESLIRPFVVGDTLLHSHRLMLSTLCTWGLYFCIETFF